MNKPSLVKIEATRHRYRITTDTGWRQGWWAFTDNGLARQLAGILGACGFRVATPGARNLIALARAHGSVSLEWERSR